MVHLRHAECTVQCELRASFIPYANLSAWRTHAVVVAQITEAVADLCDQAFAGFSGGPSMVECEKMHTLPVVRFTFGGRTFDLSPDQYILKVCTVHGHRPV